MARPKFVQIPPYDISRFASLLGDSYPELEAECERAGQLFAGRAIWNVSSTLRGGGVAELLRSLLPYARGAGVDTRWVVLRETPEFFSLTKRIHNNLHGDHGDGGPLGNDQKDLYVRTLTASARHLTHLVQAGDVVLLHDCQTAGLAPAMSATGAKVIWRCHVGADRPNDTARSAWDFLRPHLNDIDAWIFSRRAYVWDQIEHAKVRVLPPSIDPTSPKNQEMSGDMVKSVLEHTGLTSGSGQPAPTYLRADGSPARIERRAEILQETHLPGDARLVAQISRWDRLKDPKGLMECFRDHLQEDETHLLLAGPSTVAVVDDPEGAANWREVGRSWRTLPPRIRRRVHLLSLPMKDLDENAAMVNALQRRADIVVQKSLAEGFGLTVTEAMWKYRPVVGTRVGGIQDQIVDGKSGLLVDDPRDLAALARAISYVDEDPVRATNMGREAHRRVFDHYLAPRRLVEYAKLVAELEDLP